MRYNYFQNDKNIRSRVLIRNKDKSLRENNNISYININRNGNSFNTPLNNQIQIQKRVQTNYNMIEQKQNHIINIHDKNKNIIINRRNNEMQNINNNVYHNTNNKFCLVSHRANDKGTNKNEKKIQNHFVYYSKYFKKDKKNNEISGNDSSDSQSTKISTSELIKNFRNEANSIKKESETQKLISKINKLIRTIKLERKDIKAYTNELKAQTNELKAQTNELKAQTNELKVQTNDLINLFKEHRKESQKQHAELVSLLIKNLNEKKNKDTN